MKTRTKQVSLASIALGGALLLGLWVQNGSAEVSAANCAKCKKDGGVWSCPGGYRYGGFGCQIDVVEDTCVTFGSCGIGPAPH